MNVQELISALEKAIDSQAAFSFDDEAIVYAYDADEEAYAPVTGFTYDRGSNFVTLMTDTDDEVS